MKQQISKLMYKKYLQQAPNWPDYNKDAGYDWIKQQSGMPWLRLDIEIPWHTILSEITHIKQYFVEHRDDYADHFGWKSFCLHGKSHDATRENEFYDDQRPLVWTDLAKKLMPSTVNFFQNRWPGSDFNRVRVMELAPGGYISLHRDSTVSELTPINIAITQPQDCNFVFEKNGRVPFLPGQAYWLDVSQLHTVFNDSDEYRYHIIVHQNCDHQNFKKLVVKSYHDMYNKDICHKQS